MILEILKYITSNFWIFLGTVILIGAITNFVYYFFKSFTATNVYIDGRFLDKFKTSEVNDSILNKIIEIHHHLKNKEDED